LDFLTIDGDDPDQTLTVAKGHCDVAAYGADVDQRPRS
jgi:hypothetical protein